MNTVCKLTIILPAIGSSPHPYARWILRIGDTDDVNPPDGRHISLDVLLGRLPLFFKYFSIKLYLFLLSAGKAKILTIYDQRFGRGQDSV